ncbi:MAG: tRNA epoxyqueuosine(34) reductase QueG [Longimicrobiales bacterium]
MLDRGAGSVKPDVEQATEAVSPRDRSALARAVKTHARNLGFDLVGITALEPSAHAAFYQEWLAQQHHGAMDYLARPDAIARRLDARAHVPQLRSAIVVAMNYASTAGEDESESADRGIIARYARGRDYHKVIKKKLLELLALLERDVGHALPAGRGYVDTGPVLERELAQRAGLGWFGRNTMLIHPRRGSYFFLGILLVELDLLTDAPLAADHCGSCNACVEACPTGALLGRNEQGAPVIAATRCISYLTIEQRGPIPRELRPQIGNRILGCDICQEVCPFTRKFSSPTNEPGFAPRPGMVSPSLVSLMRMSRDDWDEFSRGSAVRRAGREGFLRNVAVALGSWGTDQAIAPLAGALDDDSALVRGHAAWALGRIPSPRTHAALQARLEREDDASVREEIEAALLMADGTDDG